MASKYTYPGVYVEEVPSGVRTIAEVSTSNTAFVGYFARGSTERPIRCNSFADFEREFGGLDPKSSTSYAIWQYYLNGGAVAYVVRVVANATAAMTTLFGGTYTDQATLEVTAASPGDWGNDLEVAVDHNVSPDLVGQAFNLVAREVREVNGKSQAITTEVFRNLTMTAGDARYAPDVVNEASALVRLEDKGLGELPTATPGDPIGTPDAATFFKLGKSRPGLDPTQFQEGSDGTQPGTPEWRNTDGALALKGSENDKTGLYQLEKISPEIFNLLCIPDAVTLSPDAMKDVYGAATTYVRGKRAFLLIDIPANENIKTVNDWIATDDYKNVDALRDDYAAAYFPRISIADPENDYRRRDFAASGTLAGIYARTDSNRGVWKAPAGVDANLRGSAEPALEVNDLENGQLNQQAINVVRAFPGYGNVSWGARTLDGTDAMASEWKYIPVRRTALFIEESLYQGLKWVVFEPNDEKLWGQIRLNVGAFMHTLFRRGAFQGTSPRDAYFVKCDKDTTTQTDINSGIVNIWVGFAPLKPAEFVVIQIQQMAGQIEV